MAYFPRLRDLREDSDLTQNQLVEILHMHKTTYTNYEQGKREIPFSLVVRLAKFYNVTITLPALPTSRDRLLKTENNDVRGIQKSLCGKITKALVSYQCVL